MTQSLRRYESHHSASLLLREDRVKNLQYNLLLFSSFLTEFSFLGLGARSTYYCNKWVALPTVPTLSYYGGEEIYFMRNYLFQTPLWAARPRPLALALHACDTLML